MANDLVERLRKLAERERPYGSLPDTLDEAAARIEQLEAALRPFAKAADGFDIQRISNPEEWFAYGGIRGNHETVGAITVGDLRRARAALGNPWKCPINNPECKSNCGSYGCGN